LSQSIGEFGTRLHVSMVTIYRTESDRD